MRRVLCRCALPVLLGLLVLGVGCVNDRCVDPERAEPEELLVYVGIADNSLAERDYKFYVYDGERLALLDSIPLPSYPRRLEISPNGDRLYLSRLGNRAGLLNGVAALDARTGEEIWSQDVLDGFEMELSLLNAGSVVVFDNRVFSAEDGTEIRRIPDTLRLSHGPRDGTQIAAIVTDTNFTPDNIFDTLVTALDVLTGTTSGAFIPRLSSGQVLLIFHARLHPDGRRVCLTGAVGTAKNAWFLVGDLITGETLLEHRLYSAAGEIAINEHGTIAAVAEPSSLPSLWTNPSGLHIFDLAELHHLKRFEATDFGSVDIGQVRFYPDGKNLIVAGSPMPGPSAERFHKLNVEELQVVTTVITPRVQAAPGALGVGPAP